jgi:hypothetical protein
VNLGDFVTDTPARSSRLMQLARWLSASVAQVIVGDDLVGGTPQPD